MTQKHMVEILESAPLFSLSEGELMMVKTHVPECHSCRSVYEAAQMSALAVRERARVMVEPPPFFQTKVLAALRERQAADNEPALLRLWKSASALVSSLAVTTAALAALSFLVPAPATPTFEETAYSAESIIFDQVNDEQMTYEQVLSTIYAEEDEAK